MQAEEQFIPLVRKHTELVKGVVVYALAIVIFMVAVVPIFQSANSARKKLTSEKKKLDDLSNRVVILTGLDDAILNQRYDELNNILPAKKDIVSYLVTIDGLSKDLELSLNGISLAPGDVSDSTVSAETTKNLRAGQLRSIETDISIQGEESDIYSFLRSIENVVPLMQVKDVNVSRNEGVYTLSLRLGMLYSEEGLGTNANTGVVSLFTPDEERLYNQLLAFKRYRLEDLPTLGTGQGVGIENLFTPLELRLSGSLPQSESQSSPQESPQPELP